MVHVTSFDGIARMDPLQGTASGPVTRDRDAGPDTMSEEKASKLPSKILQERAKSGSESHFSVGGR